MSSKIEKSDEVRKFVTELMNKRVVYRKFLSDRLKKCICEHVHTTNEVVSTTGCKISKIKKLKNKEICLCKLFDSQEEVDRILDIDVNLIFCTGINGIAISIFSKIIKFECLTAHNIYQVFQDNIHMKFKDEIILTSELNSRRRYVDKDFIDDSIREIHHRCTQKNYSSVVECSVEIKITSIDDCVTMTKYVEECSFKEFLRNKVKECVGEENYKKNFVLAKKNDMFM